MEKGGIILFIIFWVIMVGIIMASSNNDADLRSEGGYEPCKTLGHPLYTDC